MACEVDKLFGSSLCEAKAQAVTHLDEMLLQADRRRAPLAAGTVAARFEHPSVVEPNMEFHVGVLEATRDGGVECADELREQRLQFGAMELFVGERGDHNPSVEKRARRRILQRKLAGK